MAAIISGNGLGLLNTSLNNVGGQGVSGNGSFGQAGGQAYVNIATGNLVIQTLDQRLAAIGQDIAPVRTYNSLGTMVGGDKWNWEGERRAYLSSGTLNVSGSKITVVEADGHGTVYQYDELTNIYQSKEGDGAYDTIDASVVGKYVWTDGSSQLKIEYDTTQSGRLKSITGPDGTKQTYTYTGNRLTSIRDTNTGISGEEVIFGYDAEGRLEKLITKHGGVQTQNITYGYEPGSNGRLITVTTDLTPEKGGDSEVYITKYTYKDGPDNLIASIGQSDGTRVAFTYELVGDVNGENKVYKVKTVTDASGVTKFEYNYGGATNAVVVTNALEERWKYIYHTNSNYEEQLFAVSALSTNENGEDINLNYTRFYYDEHGNLERIRDPLSKDVMYHYDDRGNRIREFDHLGNVVIRSYYDNQLSTETRYTEKATLAAGSDWRNISNWQLPATGQKYVTRYVYDDNKRLSFVISPEDRLTRYIYNSFGLLQYVATYTKPYTPTVFRFDELNSWIAVEANKLYTAMSQFSYDNNGNLKRQIDYAVLSSNNNPYTTDNTARITDYVYDQHGRLLQQIIRHGDNHNTKAIDLPETIGAKDSFTSFAYDGLGRLTTETSAAGTTTYTYTANLTSTGAINYTGGKIATSTSASGLFTLQSYDAYGRITSRKQSASADMDSSNTRQTSYVYGQAGRLVITTLATGAQVFNFYDLLGRLAGVVDAAGQLTQYVYYANGLLKQEIRYATAVSTASLYESSGKLKARVEDILPAENSKDRIINKSYDAAGRLESVTDAGGNQTVYGYDGSDRLTKVTNGDRITRYFYDGENRQVAVLDASGYLSEDIYNAAGQKIRSNRYSVLTDSSKRASGTLDDLRPSGDTEVLSTLYFYNKRGQVTGVIDDKLFVTSYSYDEKENQRITRRYAAASAPTGSWTTALASATTNSEGKYQETVETFNEKEQLKERKEANGRITTFDYDEAGRLKSTIYAAGQGDERRVLNRYNVFGELKATLSGEAAALTIGKSDGDINAIFDKYGIKSFYDAAGRKTHVMDAAGQLTTFYYDTANRLTHVINADGDVVESGYNIFGELEKTTRYYSSLTTGDGAAPADVRATAARGFGKQLKGGILTDDFNKLIYGGTNSSGTNIVGIRNTAEDQIDTLTYNSRGLVETQTNGIAGNLTTLRYNRFGELENKEQKVKISGVSKTITENYQYSKRGELKVLTEDVGGLNLKIQREYDAFGRVIKVTDARGKTTTTDYSQDKGRKIVVTAPKDNVSTIVSTITYDAWGRQVEVNNNDNITKYVYDDTLNPANNNRSSMTVTSPEGVTITTSYNLHGEVVEVKDKAGNKTTYVYNLDGQKETEIDAGGNRTTYTYGSQNSTDGREKFGFLKETLNAVGLRTTYSYDYASRVTSRKEYLTQDIYNETSYSFDGQGRQLTVTESTGTASPRTITSKTAYSYDKAGRLEKVIQDPDGLKLQTTYKYDELGQQVEVWQGTTTDTDQQVTRYVFDTAGRRIKEIQDPNGLALTTEYRYNANGAVLRRIDAGGNNTWYVYDDAGNMIFTVDGAGGIVKYVYNRSNQLVATYKSAAHKGVSGYIAEDTDALPSNMGVDNNGEYIRTVYDTDGRVRYTIDGMGNVSEKTYNTLGQLSATIIYSDKEAGLTTEALTVSAVSAALSGNDVLSKTSYFYDVLGRVQYSVDGLGYVTGMAYDAVGNLTRTSRFKSPVSKDTIPTLDTLASTYSLSKPNISSYSYYDSLGRKVVEVNGEGEVSRYEYNARGQLVASYKVAIKDTELRGALDDTIDNYRTKIDALSADKVIVNRYFYDSVGRLVYGVDGLGYVTANEYNPDGTVKNTKVYSLPVLDVTSQSSLSSIGTKLAALPTPRQTDFYYDSVGRKVIEVDPANYVTRYDYDAVGNLTAQTRVNDIEDNLKKLLPANTESSAVSLKTAIDLMAASTPAKLQTTRYYYDAGSRLVYIVDAMGYAKRNYIRGDARVYATRTYKVALTGVTSQSTTADIANKIAGDNLLTWTYYDKAGRKTVEEDAAGYVTRYEYDAFSNLVALTRVNATGASLVSGERTSDNLQAAIDKLKTNEPAKLQITTYYYDAVGRNTYTIDAEGAASLNEYDDYGNLYKLIKYATPVEGVVSPGVLPVINTGGPKQVSAFYYDKNGRLTYQLDAASYATINEYDAFGNLKATTRLSDALPATGLANIIAARDDSSKLRITTSYEYDKLGRKTKETDGESKSVSTKYDGFGNAVIVTDKLGNNGYFYYDNLNRNVGKLDPEGHYTGYYYDGFGRQTEERKYANPVKLMEKVLPTGATLPIWVQIMREGDAPPTDRPYIAYGGTLLRTKFEYDLLDRKTKITYPVSTITEVYEYNDGSNQPSRYQNKLGGWYSYTYDRLGRLKTETLPVKTFNSDNTALLDVVNTYDYDGFGNKTKFTEASGLAEQRVSVFGYDKLNRLTSKTAESVEMLVFQSTDAAGDKTSSTGVPTETYQYDSFGNQILKTDANGAKTFSYYDLDNRKTHEIKQVNASYGYVSYWEYNAAGQAILLKQYETAISLPAVADAGGKPPAAPTGTVREMRYTYDKVGRQTATILPGATVYDHDDNGVYGLYNSVDLITSTEYDANGNIIRLTDARGNTSYTYYDKIGRKILFVDNESYVTRWEYDDAANKQKETRYATALERVVKETFSAASILNVLVSINANDRITTTTFDNAGRALVIEVAKVAYGTVNNSGDLTSGITNSTTTAQTRYTYNGLDQVTEKVEGYGSTGAVTTKMDYDALGRQILTTFGEFTDVDGVNVKQRIATEYNGLGLTRQVAILGNSDSFYDPVPKTRMTFKATDDRITTYSYDKLGRLIQEKDKNKNLEVDDANGNKIARYHEVNYSYDLAGNQTRISTFRSVAGTATRKQDDTLIAYDLQGRETARRIQSRDEGGTLTSASILEQRETRYNAFGEVIGKRLVKFDSTTKATDPWQELTEYNNQGKVWKTNADKGAVKYYVYDRNGNATLQLDTLSGAVTAATAADLNSLNNVTYTETHYDKRNQVVEIRQPQFTQTMVDARINIFEQPVNYQDDVADSFTITKQDNKDHARFNDVKQQFMMVNMGATVKKVVLHYWPKTAAISTYNTKMIEMQAAGSGTFVLNYSALDVGEYNFKYYAYDASDNYLNEYSGIYGIFKRELGSTSSTYPGGSITVSRNTVSSSTPIVNSWHDSVIGRYSTSNARVNGSVSGAAYGPLTLTYEIDNDFIRRSYGSGYLILSWGSSSSQMMAIDEAAGSKTSLSLTQTVSIINTMDISLTITLVQDGVYTTIAKGNEQIKSSHNGYSIQNPIPLNTGGWADPNGIHFIPKKEIQIKAQPYGTERVDVVFREKGSTQAFQLLDSLSNLWLDDDDYISWKCVFDLNLANWEWDANKEYEIVYIAVGGGQVLNRQQGVFSVSDNGGINISIAPQNFESGSFASFQRPISQRSDLASVYDVGPYYSVKYRIKGTGEWKGGIVQASENRILDIHPETMVPFPYYDGGVYGGHDYPRFSGEIELQIDAYNDAAGTLLNKSLVGSITIVDSQALYGPIITDININPRVLSQTVSFDNQPLSAKTLVLKYGASDTALNQSITLSVEDGHAFWNLANELALLSPTASKTLYYELTAYDDLQGAGLVVNKASGTINIGVGGGAATLTAAAKNTYVDIQPPQGSYARMDLYYRLRPTDPTGSFVDIFEGKTGLYEYTYQGGEFESEEDIARSKQQLDSLKQLNFTKVAITPSNNAYRWNTSVLIPDSGYADYEYFYELYDENNQRLGFVPGQLHVTANGSGFLKQSKWQINDAQDESKQIIRSQTYNAFGEIDAERDGNGNVATMVYNTMGKLIEKHLPETDVTSKKGKTTREKLIIRYYYDLAGRLVSVVDAKGNKTNSSYVNARNLDTGEFQVATTYQADGGTTGFKYNVYGDLIQQTQKINAESSVVTQYGYDAAGRLLMVARPYRAPSSVSGNPATFLPPSIIADIYFYDEQDNRIQHLNAIGLIDTTSYDALGRIIQTTTGEGTVTKTTYSYDSSILGVGGVKTGGIIRTVLDANNMTSVDKMDYFGRTTWHKDLGGNTYTYQYDTGGRLTRQTNSKGQDIDYEYYNNGYQSAVRDNTLKVRTEYIYDNNGNQTGLRYLEINSGGEARIYQNAHIDYDELNRKAKIWDETYSISYEYDENSNVRHMLAYYINGTNGYKNNQDFWYDYDQMNRFTVSMGRLNTTSSGVTSIVAGETGVQLSYDFAGQRTSAKYGQDAMGTDTAHTEKYTYTADGYLEKIEANTNQASSSTYYTIAERQNDALGRIINYKTFKLNSGDVEEEVITEYNGNNQVKKQQSKKGTTTNTTDYFYLDDNTTLEKTVSAQQTTQYSYEWWDGAKQSQIRVQANGNWYRINGWSDFGYDVNGHLKVMTDKADSLNQREVSFLNNSQGMILQRNELINDAMNRYHNFYYVDGKRIGDIGNEGTSREDYVTQMANAKTSVAAKDFKPISSADFDQSYEPINQNYPSSASGSYTVNAGDTLQSVALAVWGDSSMWYVLADVNGLSAGDELKAGQLLIIPNKVTNIHHNSETFRPYNPGEAIGDTQPTLPEPPPPPKPKKKCGGIAQVVMIIVAVAVTVISMGTLGPLLAAALGSVSSQLVGKAMGEVDHFSWKQVGVAALSSALSYGFGGGATAFDSAAATQTTGQMWAAAATNALKAGVANYASTYVANQVFGVQQKFSWAGLGASVAGAMVGGALEQGKVFDGWGPAASYAYSLTGANAGAMMDDKWFGADRPNYVNVSMNAIANTAGRKFGEKLKREMIEQAASPMYLTDQDKQRILKRFGNSNKADSNPQAVILRNGEIRFEDDARASQTLTENPDTEVYSKEANGNYINTSDTWKVGISEADNRATLNIRYESWRNDVQMQGFGVPRLTVAGTEEGSFGVWDTVKSGLELGWQAATGTAGQIVGGYMMLGGDLEGGIRFINKVTYQPQGYLARVTNEKIGRAFAALGDFGESVAGNEGRLFVDGVLPSVLLVAGGIKPMISVGRGAIDSVGNSISFLGRQADSLLNLDWRINLNNSSRPALASGMFDNQPLFMTNHINDGYTPLEMRSNKPDGMDAARVEEGGGSGANKINSIEPKLMQNADGFYEVNITNTPLDAHKRLNEKDLGGNGKYKPAEAAMAAQLESLLGEMERYVPPTGAKASSSPDFTIKSGMYKDKTVDAMYTTDYLSPKEVEGINKYYAKNMASGREMDNILKHINKADFVPVDFRVLNAVNQQEFLNFAQTLSASQKAKIIIVR